MTAALLSGLLVTALLARHRVRPDHRLRTLAPAAGTPPPTGTPPRLRRRTRRCRPDELAGWCDALARDVRSGATLRAALRAAEPPAGSSLREVGRRLQRGASLADALSVRVASPHEQAALTVLAACAHHGGPAAQPLDRVAATLRRRAADEAERAVHSAQARLSALVMTVLPGTVLLLLITTSASVRTVTATPTGAIVVACGLGLNALGWWWMRRIIGGGRR